MLFINRKKLELLSKTFKIQIHGLPFKIDTIQLDNQLEAIEAVEEHGYLSITVNEDFTELDFNSATLTP